MLRPILLWLGGALVVMGVAAGLIYFAYWYQFVREVTWESWTVALPSGGTLSYEDGNLPGWAALDGGKVLTIQHTTP